MLDLTTFKKKSEIDREIYSYVTDAIRTHLVEKGEEFRALGKKTEVKIAKTLDKDGEEIDIWCGIEPLVHKYFVTTSPKTNKILPAFDIDKKTTEYEEKRLKEEQRKQEKKEQAEKRKEKTENE